MDLVPRGPLPPPTPPGCSVGGRNDPVGLQHYLEEVFQIASALKTLS